MVVKSLISLCTILVLASSVSNAQEKLIVEGAITVGDSEGATPDAGTIRWTGTDFEGWTGSQWVSLTSGPCGGLTFVKDMEANTYPIVAIGTQCWMAVNLRTKTYNDNTAIPLVNSSVDWGTVTTPAYSWYNDNSGMASPYGALYNWYAVDMASNGNKNLCPVGWHIPTEQEFSTLQTFLGGESTADIPMKEAGSLHFLDDNETATNESGFTAIPGGYRSGTNFCGKGYYAQYWTSTSNSATTAKFLDIQYDGGYANSSNGFKNQGYSIRCIKDFGQFVVHRLFDFIFTLQLPEHYVLGMAACIDKLEHIDAPLSVFHDSLEYSEPAESRVICIVCKIDYIKGFEI